METRIALPGAMAGAIMLGIAFSALVPTRMVGPKAPPWATAAPHQQVSQEPGPTFAFTPAPPIDLDPSRPVGPQYAIGDDVMGYSVPVATISPDDVPRAPVYVAVSYGSADQVRNAAAPEPFQPSSSQPRPERFEGLY